MTRSATLATRLATAATESHVTYAAATAASALAHRVTGVADPQPADSIAFWVTCAALHHGAAVDATRSRIEQGIVVGVEAGCLVRRSLIGHTIGGWDPVCAAVVIGTTLAATRIDASERETTVRAIGFAATQAAGLDTGSPSAFQDFQRRRAAADGLQAAALARAGLSAPASSLDGDRGLFALMAPTADKAAVMGGFGPRWAVTTLADSPPATPVASWDALLRRAVEVMA